MIRKNYLWIGLVSCLAGGAAAAEKSHVFTEATAGNSHSSAEADQAAIVECPSSTARAAISSGRVDVESTLVLESEGVPTNIQMIRVPGKKETCPFMTSPERRPLSLTEYRAATAPRINRSAISTIDELVQTVDAGSQLVGRMQSKTGCSVVQPLNIGRLAAGACGDANSPFASVYFLGSNLAITSGAILGTEFCVYTGSGASRTFYDVHDVRRISTGNSGVVGLSLMRAAPATGQIGTVTGPLAGTLQVDGVLTQQSDKCQSGLVVSDNGLTALFLGDIAPSPWSAFKILPGGPARFGPNLSVPMGVHLNNGVINTGTNEEVYPIVRRYQTSEVPVLNDWLATAAPPADKDIVINYPSSNQLVDNAVPLNISVASASGYTLKLDGQVVGSTIVNLTSGPHTLIAYNSAFPKYRHTISFEAATLSNPADSYEVDNQREAFTALFEGSPQLHNFHTQFDRDWVAYAVGPLTRSTVTLSGNVALNSQIRLYRQLNYPSGSIDLVGTRQNTQGQLVLADNNPDAGLAVYYVEAMPTSINGSGAGSQYSISVQTVPLADSFEFDGQLESFNALFEGTPQTHTFHLNSDADWVAYAVTAGTSSRVDLTGSPAEFAQLEMYRQFDYPNGAIELVGSNALVPGTLSVQDTAPQGQGLVVYYVVARPFNFNPGAVKSTYTMSVHTQ